MHRFRKNKSESLRSKSDVEKKPLKITSVEYLTTNQLQGILLKAMENNRTHFMILYTLAHSGMRVGELVTLIPLNINYELLKIFVIGKGNKLRSIDISMELAVNLRDYIKTKNIKAKNRLFPYYRESIWRIAKQYSGKKTHIFRHTYAINLLRQCRNPKYVQQQLGHKNFSTTAIYLQYMDFEEEKQKLGELYK